MQRPGRFDHKIEIRLPSAPERADIIKIHLKNKKHNLQQLEISKAATELDGFSGAEIENVVNLAALETVKSGARLLENEHFQLKVAEAVSEKKEKNG